jgi:8-oxo-dGTP diphosphatase
MKLLKYIFDKPLPKDKKVAIRFAARAIVFNDKNQIPVLFVSKFNYHKLPGGGIEDGEDKITACKREMLEETGCKVEITGELGKITEYRSEFNLFQTSYCYTGKVLSVGTSALMPDEIEEGYKLIWLTLPEAIKILKTDKPSNYEGGFIQKRDLRFFEEAKMLRS